MADATGRTRLWRAFHAALLKAKMAGPTIIFRACAPRDYARGPRAGRRKRDRPQARKIIVSPQFLPCSRRAPCDGRVAHEVALVAALEPTNKRTKTMTTTTSNKPTHRIYAVTKRGEKSTWDEIGAAWPHKDGKGFNLKLDYLPLNGGELSLRVPMPKDKTDDNTASAQDGEV
jgi:hypothetical protein